MWAEIVVSVQPLMNIGLLTLQILLMSHRKVKTFTIKSKELKYGKWVSISSHKITPAMNDEKVSQVSLTSEGNEETGKAIPSLSF